MNRPSLSKIISGGQTGVDRAALEVAMFLEIPHGGWCPKGRRAEDGPIPEMFNLIETSSFNYAVRTEKNVVQSDGTLILFRDIITRGTGLTVQFAKRHQRPYLCIDMSTPPPANDDGQHEERESIDAAAEEILSWLAQHNINVLNIAGPRESTTPNISSQSHTLLLNAFANIAVE
jgi:hypothetical protein